MLTSCGKRENYYACKTSGDPTPWNVILLDKHFVWSYGSKNEVKNKIISEDSEKVVIKDEPGDKSIFFKKSETLLVILPNQNIELTWKCKKLN